MSGSDSRLVRVSRPAVLLALALTSLAAGSPRSAPRPVRELGLVAEKDGVRPGEILRVALRVSLDREYHVNSHVPSQEYLIPTSVEADPPPGLALGEWEYPEGVMRRFPFADDPLRIYEGTFLIRGEVRVALGAPPGSRQLTARLRYQACTRERCYPPRREEIPFEVRVVPDGAAVRSLHPEIFASPDS